MKKVTTNGDYYGLIDGKYQRFDTEDQYYEALRESEEDKESP